MQHRFSALPWLAALAAALAAFAATLAIAAPAARALDPVTGTRDALVIVVEWDEQPGFPATPADRTPGEVASVMANQVSPWYQGVSRGQFNGWQVDSAGPYTIDPRDPNRPGATCAARDPNEHIARRARDAAAAHGIDAGDYDNVIIYSADPEGCEWASRGLLSGRDVWLRGARAITFELTHELGHNLGLNHSGSVTCFDDDSGQRVPLSDNCIASAYGDPFSAMGGSRVTNFTSSQQYALGWLGQRRLDLSIGDTPAHFFLQPITDPGLTIQALRVPDSDTTYWVEGWTGPGSAPGVLIRQEDGGDPTGTRILDMAPDLADDTTLLAGSSWINPFGNLRYTVNSVSALGIEVTIEKKYAPVPDVIGMRRTAATTALTNAGYTLGTVRTRVDASCNYVDTVMDQTPGAGNRLAPGTAVSITLGLRPAGGCQ